MFSRRQAVLGSGILLLAPALTRAQKAKPTVKPYVVRLYSQHPEDATQKMVFLPRLLRVPSGATVRFEPEEPTHNCMSTPGMIPKGAQSWNGPFGKPFEMKFVLPGYYGYHCLAHRGMGMVGLVIVEGRGRDNNLKAARSVKHTGRAAEVWAEIWTQAGGSTRDRLESSRVGSGKGP